jgi:SAM-dependent methyltransferase
LSGLRGIEIGGAAYNEFFLDTINVDHRAEPTSSAMQLRFAGRPMPVDVVAKADDLPFTDGSFDFVLASHVLEHVPDPIHALGEWVRVASRYVFVILPQPDNEWNAGRPVTPLYELVQRNRAGFSSDEDPHWSIWSSGSFALLCKHLGLEILEIQDPDDKRGNGFAVAIDARRVAR